MRDTTVTILLGTGLVLLAFCLVLRLYPPLGAKAAGNRLQTVRGSAHYVKNKFVNLIPTSMSTGLRDMLSTVKEMIRGIPNSRPQPGITAGKLNPADLANPKESKVIWLGHSSLLVQISGLTLLLDPMFGTAPSPVPFVGGKRYSPVPPVDVNALPPVDAVLLSHDHYDHLDYGTIRRLHRKVGHFYVPLGVGAHLERWGVPAAKITETDWWDELELKGLKLHCTPSRHFSGRSLTDRNATLWCSWVLEGEQEKIFFSGDSGYGPHFREIGKRYGPFDLTLMECGQYNERWEAIHMLPEQTVLAHQEVGGKLLLPIHWGAFTLSLHAWNEPVERAAAAADKQGVPMVTPRIGEPVLLGGTSQPSTRWWRKV
jgi:L-ascorbate metabolism protein UlaG (beta-lactamase superfamily)